MSNEARAQQRPEWSPSVWVALRWLGYGGWLPFALGLMWAVSGVATPVAERVLIAYSVSIVTFVGALSWAWALALPDLAPSERRRLLIWSVVPSLLATACVAWPSPWMWWGLAGVYGLAFFMDWRHNQILGWPLAWLRLRAQLTAGAVLAMLLAGFWL